MQKIGLFNIPGQIKVNNILFDCGKDMANRYDLHHWDNTHFKNFIIVTLCELKNTVYLVTENGSPVATFQTKKDEKSLRFEKLACSPKFSGKGIGSYCMKYIETIAEQLNCEKVCMEVYSPSQHALDFYLHKGYVICGETNTLKYSEVKMEKEL
ncbi:TPA: GNAT family N-acetyltransferase [Streptococcus suis]